MENKLATYLGFAKKSGKIVYGVDNILDKSKKAIMLMCDKSLSENSFSKIKNISERVNIKIYVTDNLDKILNTTNCKAIAITSKDLAKAIQELNILKEV